MCYPCSRTKLLPIYPTVPHITPTSYRSGGGMQTVDHVGSRLRQLNPAIVRHENTPVVERCHGIHIPPKQHAQMHERHEIGHLMLQSDDAGALIQETALAVRLTNPVVKMEILVGRPYFCFRDPEEAFPEITEGANGVLGYSVNLMPRSIFESHPQRRVGFRGNARMPILDVTLRELRDIGQRFVSRNEPQASPVRDNDSASAVARSDIRCTPVLGNPRSISLLAIWPPEKVGCSLSCKGKGTERQIPDQRRKGDGKRRSTAQEPCSLNEG